MTSSASWKTRAFAAAILTLVVTQGNTGCGTESTEGGAVCTYGESHACEGPDGCTGVEACLPDLTGYTECTCERDGGTDAAVDAQADAQVDATDDGAATP